MSKIWFCRNCGYEVSSRGRCHACKERLSSSPLPELVAGDEDDEVGYRLQDWSDRSRGRLIVRLIEANVLHRFDGDELVVAADDEVRTDDLVDEITAEADIDDEDGGEVDDPVHDAIDEELLAQVENLLAAGRRLRDDPTDMQADGDLAHASGTVFIADGFYGVDAQTWAAVGRVTRRLLGALGADEALDDEIRLQAGILVKLLEPVLDGSGVEESTLDEGPATGERTLDEASEIGERTQVDGVDGPGADASGDASDGDASDGDASDGSASDGSATDGNASDGSASGGDSAPTAVGASGGDTAATAGESVYDLPEWLPEQRAQLSVLLDEASIGHAWEGGDLVVAMAAEDDVEAMFDRIDGVNHDEDDGARYRALEALFAAADRFVNDPDSRPKRLEVVRCVADADGPTPLGLDDAQWWSIRSRARLLADSIEHDANLEVIFAEATTLRDLLRVLV